MTIAVCLTRKSLHVRDEGRVTDPRPAGGGPDSFLRGRLVPICAPSQSCCPSIVGAGLRVLDKPPPECQENSARRSHRLVIMTTC